MALRRKVWERLASDLEAARTSARSRTTIGLDELPGAVRQARSKGEARGGSRDVVAYRGLSPRSDRAALAIATTPRRRRPHGRYTGTSTAARSTSATRSGASRRRSIDWETPFDEVLDYSRPPFARWFVGGTTNLCHNAVDRHLAHARRPEGARLHLDRDRQDARRYTYRELHAEVNRFAAMLRAQGVGTGDRVLIYMPMIPEAVFAMLACARIGAIHSVVFGGFAAASLATRIDDATPEGDVHGRRRHARRPGDPVQAARRRSDPPREASAGAR